MAECKICNGKRHIFKEGVGWVRCSCVGEARADRIMAKSNFPVALHRLSSSSFKMSTKERIALGEAIKKEISSFDKKPFFIYSSSLEKDRVAAIISRYLIKQHASIESVSFTSLEALTEAFFKKEDQETEEVEQFNRKADIVTISIGKEITNTAHRNILYKLLYDRILGEQFTIIISSIPKSRIRQVYLEDVDNLLTEYCSFFEC